MVQMIRRLVGHQPAALLIPWLIVSGPDVSGASALDPRALPTVIERWSIDGEFETMVVADHDLYLAGAAGIVAIDPTDGAVRWRRAPSGECEEPIVVAVERSVAWFCGSKVVFLGGADGEPRWTLDLSGRAMRAFGPPLIALVSTGEKSSELISIDVETGTVLGISQRLSAAYDLTVLDGVAIISSDDPINEELTLYEGFELPLLRPVWATPRKGFKPLSSTGGRIYAEVADESGGCTYSERELDVRSGTFGPALPEPPQRGWSRSDYPIDFQYDEVPAGERPTSSSGPSEEEPDQMAYRLFHLDPLRGAEVWSVELPGAPQVPHRFFDRLALPLDREGGRGLLAVLDSASGRLLEIAFGLPAQQSEVAVQGDLLLIRSNDTVRSFELSRFGAPESDTMDVASASERILLPTGNKGAVQLEAEDLWDGLSELRLLGRAACEPTVALLSRVDPEALAVAAVFLSEQQCKAAAAPLALRLESLPVRVGDRGWAESTPIMTVLRALADLGGEAEVTKVAAILRSPDASPEVRAEAFTTLATIGTASAMEAVRESLSVASPSTARFPRPDPRILLEFIGVPVPDWGSFEDPEEQKEFWRTWDARDRAARSSMVTLEGGERAVVFPSAAIGGPGDLWVALLDPNGSIRRGPWFSGFSRRAARGASVEEKKIAVVPDANRISIRDRGGAQLFAADLDDLGMDQDADGLTDIEERRLRLSETERDTDHDGAEDAVDPAPNAREEDLRTEEGRRELAIFEQFFRLASGQVNVDDLLIVDSDRALEWRGRSGPTLTLGEAEAKVFMEEVGYDGVYYLTISIGDAEAANDDDWETECRPRDAGELRVEISLYAGPHNAVFYGALVRKVDDPWLITRLCLEAIS